MPSLSVERVCIIDDDKIYVTLVSKIIELRKISKELLVFKNGKEAIDYFIGSLTNKEEEVPEIILLDLNMPVMNGWEFLEEFSKIRNQLDKEISLYVVSSSIDSRDIDRAKNIQEVTDYLTKPIKLIDFERIVASSRLGNVS